jgi:hypothetical protein
MKILNYFLTLSSTLFFCFATIAQLPTVTVDNLLNCDIRITLYASSAVDITCAECSTAVCIPANNTGVLVPIPGCYMPPPSDGPGPTVPTMASVILNEKCASASPCTSLPMWTRG